MKLKMLSIALLSTFILTSCVIDDGDNNITNNTNQGIKNYLPNKVGSWWTFTRDDGNEYKREATGEKATVNTRQYDKFKYTKLADMDDNPEYFGKFDNKYYAVFDFKGDATEFYEAIIMVDTPEVNKEWTNTGTVNFPGVPLPANVKITGKILNMAETIAISDTTFTNAIKVEYLVSGTIATIPVDAGRIYNWFVPGVGIVKQDYDVTISTFYSQKYVDVLKAYYIAP